MKYRRRFTLNDPVFDTNLHVFIGWTWEGMKAATLRKYPLVIWDEDDAWSRECDGRYLDLKQEGIDSKVRVLWIASYKADNRHRVIISHEAKHASFEILRDRGVRFSEDSEEVFCYHHDFILASILKAL
jgi:hypothetical protein